MDNTTDNCPAKFGQVIIGPPGSGKTTYCLAMKEYYKQFNRNCILINLDPANETTSKVFDIDIREWVSLDDIETSLHWGPNSSFWYCFNFLEKNFEWLKQKINNRKDNPYWLIDTPGQIEIFTWSTSFKAICYKLSNHNEMNIHLCCVSWIESINISDIPKYIFSILSVLNSMINWELPQVNLISKADWIKEWKGQNWGENPFDIGFYKNPNDNDQLNFYLDRMNTNPKFKMWNKKIAEFVSDYSLVSFTWLDIKNPKHLNRAAILADKSNGWWYNMEWINDENIDSRCMVAQNDLLNDDDEEEEYQI